jgi:hypothetical protein
MTAKTGLRRIKAAFAVLLNVSNCHIRVVPRRDLVISTARLIDVLHAMDEKHAVDGIVAGTSTCTARARTAFSLVAVVVSSLPTACVCRCAEPEEDEDLSEDAPAIDDAAPKEDEPQSSDPLPASEDAPPPPEGGMDAKHSGGLCPRVDLQNAKRMELDAERDRKAGEVAWDVISAAGRAGGDVASVIAADEHARAEAEAMERTIRRIGKSIPAAAAQPVEDDASDLVDISTDWKGDPRSVPHERPPPAPAALLRRSNRYRASRPVISAFRGVDTADIAFDDDDDDDIAASAASSSRKRSRRS